MFSECTFSAPTKSELRLFAAAVAIVVVVVVVVAFVGVHLIAI